MPFTPPDSFNIFDYFLADRVVEGNGDRRALLTDGGAWSYKAVHHLSGRYARLLIDLGVSPSHRVIIALPDGPDYVGALFGALRMGGVVVMVNPHLNADQICYFYDYIRASAAFVDVATVDHFRAAAELPLSSVRDQVR